LSQARLTDLTAHDVRSALTKVTARYSTRTLQKAHNCLTRVIRHTEATEPPLCITAQAAVRATVPSGGPCPR
jgi:hypothetical protein